MNVICLRLTIVSKFINEIIFMIGRFSERHDAPRTSFDNFLKAMLAVFQVRKISPLFTRYP